MAGNWRGEKRVPTDRLRGRTSPAGLSSNFFTLIVSAAARSRGREVARSRETATQADRRGLGTRSSREGLEPGLHAENARIEWVARRRAVSRRDAQERRLTRPKSRQGHPPSLGGGKACVRARVRDTARAARGSRSATHDSWRPSLKSCVRQRMRCLV